MCMVTPVHLSEAAGGVALNMWCHQVKAAAAARLMQVKMALSKQILQ